MILGLLGSVRVVAHNRVMSLIDSYMYRGREPVRASAYPDSGTPFFWHVVIDTGENFEEAEINLFQDFDPTSTHGFYPPEPSPVIDAARRPGGTRTGYPRRHLGQPIHPGAPRCSPSAEL